MNGDEVHAVHNNNYLLTLKFEGASNTFHYVPVLFEQEDLYGTCYAFSYSFSILVRASSSSCSSLVRLYVLIGSQPTIEVWN